MSSIKGREKQNVTRSFDFLLEVPYRQTVTMDLTASEAQILRAWARTKGLDISILKARRRDSNDNTRHVTIHGLAGVPASGICARMAAAPIGECMLLDYKGPYSYVRKACSDLAASSHIVITTRRPLGEGGVPFWRRSSLMSHENLIRLYYNAPRAPIYNTEPGDLIDVAQSCIDDHCDVEVDFITGGVKITWAYDPEVTFERVDEKTLRRLS